MKVYFVLLIGIFLSSCATLPKGDFVFRDPETVDFAIPNTPIGSDAETTLAKAAYDICLEVKGRDFKIVTTDIRNIVLLARVRCAGEPTTFSKIKYGDSCTKIDITPSENYKNGFSFQYRSPKILN